LRTLYQDVRRAAAPVLARVRDRALPQSCLLCGDAGPEAICEPCASSLPRVGADACPRCQLASVHGQVCGRCLKRPPQWQRLLAPWSYAFPFDAALLAAKYRHAFAVYRWAAEDALDGHAWPFARGATLLPVPLAPERLQARGYNQALLLARRLAGAHVRPDLLLRTREAEAQAQLTRAQRLRNLRGAFVLEPLRAQQLAGRRVLLVDDVMTTGATLHAAAAPLREAGVAHVGALVLARTP